MTYIIIGGSSGVGRALAEKFAAEDEQLILISQDKRDTEALAAHLSLTCGTFVTAIAMDLTEQDLSYELIDQALVKHSTLKGVLAPIGLNSANDCVGVDDVNFEKITRANYMSPCKLINHCLPILRDNSGVIVGFGSVATARGRSRNASYAAAKRALESYFESLMHFNVNSSASSQFYVLGYMDTNLAFAENLLFPRANPNKLARIIYERKSKEGIYFFPSYWSFIYTLVQRLPWVIFKRMSF